MLADIIPSSMGMPQQLPLLNQILISIKEARERLGTMTTYFLATL
jgi:hypothetical protein